MTNGCVDTWMKLFSKQVHDGRTERDIGYDRTFHDTVGLTKDVRFAYGRKVLELTDDPINYVARGAAPEPRTT